MAGFFRINVNTTRQLYGRDLGVVQRGGGQLAETCIQPRGHGMRLVGAGVEDPSDAQTVGEVGVVDGVGQPFKPWDFGFGGFASVGQGGDKDYLYWVVLGFCLC